MASQTYKGTSTERYAYSQNLLTSVHNINWRNKKLYTIIEMMHFSYIKCLIRSRRI